MTATVHPRQHDNLRPSLRRRVTLFFTVGALTLSGTFAALTYVIVRNYLLQQRESSAVRQAYTNARLVQSDLLAADANVPGILASLEAPAGTEAMVYARGRWFSGSIAFGQNLLPTEMRRVVLAGAAARQRLEFADNTWVGVGVPLPGTSAAYFEVSTLDTLERDLGVLAASLAAVGAITTIGGAGIGFWASGRVLRPLTAVEMAAASIAAGRLDTRIETSSDHELALLSDAFNSMADALQDRIEREARFASDVSHELRSPLTTLTASVGLLHSMSPSLPVRARETVGLLEEDVDRFNRLIEELLEISRFDAGVAELHLEDVHPGHLVEHAVRAASRRAVPVVIEPDRETRTFRLDKRRMERVVANLVENADAHGGGVTRVRVDMGDSLLRVTVEDAGPGIPEDERDRVFERFFRGAAAGRRGRSGGTGLGLSLVEEHVRLHGGTVRAEPQPAGQGTRLVVELPDDPEPGA